jgi:hypothetical protein
MHHFDIGFTITFLCQIFASVQSKMLVVQQFVHVKQSAILRKRHSILEQENDQTELSEIKIKNEFTRHSLLKSG